MSTIKIKTLNQNIVFTDLPRIYSGDIGTDYIHFEFDEIWSGFIKTAVFYRDPDKPYFQVMKDNECVIPYEVLMTAGKFYVGVVGVLEGKVLTSEVIAYEIGQGAHTPIGEIVPEPSPDLWEQILDELLKIRELAEQMKLDQEAFKTDVTKRQDNFETKITKIQSDFEVDITNKQNVFETELTERQEDFEQRVENKTGYTKDEADNRFIPTALQGTFATDLSEEYKGVASDFGAEILKIEGKSEQVTTNGYQLFDASKLPTKSQGGATVTNNGDGSFTISGSGNLTESFFVQYDVVGNDEIKKLLKVGMLSLKTNGAIKAYETNPYFHIYLSDKANERLLVIVNGQKEVTQDILNKSEKLTFTFWGSSGEAIQGGTIRPMLYQEGDGTWEPFTGGEPSPNPNYPQEINNALDEPLVSVSRNLFNASSLKEDGVINFKNEENGYKISLESNGNYKKVYCFIAENLLKALKGNSIKLKCSEDTVFSTHGAINLVVKRKNKKTEFYGINRSTFETKIIELTDDVELIKVEIIPINLGTEQENYQKLIAVGLRLYDVSNGDVEWEPYRCAETSLDLSEPLRSLPDGTCDTYDNGVITRRIGVINVDGDTQFASLNTNQNIAYLIISKYSVSGNKFFSGLCDKAKVVQTWGLKPNEITIMESPDLGGMRVLFSVPEEVNTLELLKAYFTENPMTVYYQLKTPTTEKVELPII